MPEAAVLSRREGPVLVLTLNRPERRNAWTYEMGDLYFDYLDEAEDDPEIRVIVLTAAGKGFCPGMDGAALSASAATGKRPEPAKGRAMTHARTIRKPIIAAINGACAGLGLIQAMHCDVRFAAASAVFSTAFARRGLGANYGMSWFLPRIIGHGRAMEMLVSARRVSAEEALQFGLVSAVLQDEDLMAHTLAYAHDLAVNCSPIAMADAKMQVHEDWLADCDTAEDRAKALTHAPGHRVDFAEGVASMVEKRPPSFAPLPPRAA